MRSVEYMQGYLDGLKKYIKFDNDRNLNIVDEVWETTEEINKVLNSMASVLSEKVEMTDKQKAELMIKIAKAAQPLEESNDKNRNPNSQNN